MEINVFAGGAKTLHNVVDTGNRDLVAALVAFPHVGGVGLDYGGGSCIDDGFGVQWYDRLEGLRGNVVACCMATHWVWLKKYLMRPIWTGYSGHGISFAGCWANLRELIRMVGVAGWVFMTQTGSLVMNSPSILIFVVMLMFALLVYSF